MKPLWLPVAAELLESASLAFSVFVCNDWKWPADWSPTDRFDLAAQMVAANTGRAVEEFSRADREEVDSMVTGAYGPPDWWVMSFLASQLKGIGK